MAANDAETLDAYTRIVTESDGIAVEVAVITWDGQIPQMNWRRVFTLPSDTPRVEVHKARRRLLAMRKYFALCAECRLRQVKGQMEDSRICQDCATANHGTVY